MPGGPPYWGELPPPAAVAQRQASIRRNSYIANRKAALPPDAELRALHDSPYPVEAQPNPRANRISQQSNTTQSTQSPFASPVENNFRPEGLAPRPSSYQSAPYNREAEERRRRRASRQQAEERVEHERGIPYDGGTTTGTTKYPNGHGPAPNRQSSHRARNSQDRTPLREPEDFYRGNDNRYQPQRGQLSVNTDLGQANTTGRISSQQQAADDAERGIRRGSVTARKEKPEIRSAVEDSRARRGSSRRASEMSQEGFTSDKSPLQALESTYTKLKEEKRAKAEEAERQIRQRQASGASTTRGTQNTVHFDGSSEQAAKTVSQRVVVEDDGQDISPKTSIQIKEQSQRKPSALSQPLEERPSARKLQKEPPTQSSPKAAPAPAQIPRVAEPGVQRNASFRERAGPAPEIILGTTAAVSRSNTNKLKKNPPGDPWRLNREEIEAQAEKVARAMRAEREQQARMASGGPLGSSPIDPPVHPTAQQGDEGRMRAHANTKRQREALYEAAQPMDVGDENMMNMPPVKRSNSAKKVKQLLGADVSFKRPDPNIRRAISPAEQQLYADRLDRSEELGPDGRGDIYGMTQDTRRVKIEDDVPISTVTDDYVSDQGERQARGKDGHHHFSNIIHGGRGNYRPGAGLYLPDVRLEEWKSAGIASLTGALLDLDSNAQTAARAQSEADKDKAWWEAGNKGKRRPSAVRPLEAFGGDMSSEGNNGTVFSDFSYSYEDVVPRQGTPSYGERWRRPATPQLRDIPERASSPYQERYGRSMTPALESLTRGSSTRRGAVAVVKEDDKHIVPRARNYIGFDGTSKRKSTVRKRNRSLVQPTRYSKKQKPKKRKSARRQKGPSAVTAALKKTASYFLKDCMHPERHNIFHPFHICKRFISSKSKLKSTKKERLTTSATVAPTTFKPALYLKCGPLLRYAGIRRETAPTRPGQAKRRDREIWRGSVMIVTTDAASDYGTTPTLRLFRQPRSLLPPPPETIDNGEELPHEYIDPIAGHPKCGRDGGTVYVRPVEFLPEEKDLSRDESDKGLYSRQPNSSYPATTNPTRQPTVDGEKTGKAVSVKGFRLHAERGATFWRFNIEVELITTQQRIAYRINSGPAIGFWLPARGEGMNIMNYSCNGFSMSVNSDMFSGPDPLWRDVLNTHQTRPFHVMIGGGDQVYNDLVMRETSIFAEWLDIKNPLHKHNAPFTAEMQDELEDFYLGRYAMWFSQGLFSLANSQIPMVNLWDDHDIIDGFGSYPHHFMDSPVFTGLGAIAFKYYMLFQHQSSVDEGPANEPSWLLGTKPGPYIKERSRSLFMSLGGGLSFLGLDCRTERTRDEILSEQTYDAILDRCYAELSKGTATHLIVLLGVPIAYPRLVWLENILTSRIMDPIKALSRAGAFGNLLNDFDGGVEILDDLDDHWTAKNHKAERRFLIQDLQDLAASKSARITILSGDVHLAAIGQFFSSGGAEGFGKTGEVPKDKDHRYMPNVISSAIVNTPPPDMLADVLARRDKIHHLDADTNENMIPLFGVDVDGKKRNNKVMLPRRNWASICVYDGHGSPSRTPGASRTPSPEKGGGLGGLVRRMSMTRNNSFGTGPNRRQDSFGPRPPISGNGGGLLRRLSTSRGRPAAAARGDSFDGAGGRATPPRRSLSVGGGLGGLMRRLSQSRNRPPKRRDRGGINGYDSETEEEERPYRDAPDVVRTRQGTFLRGGGQLTASEEELEYQDGERLRGGGTLSRSEEAIERQEGHFAPKKGYRRYEEPNDFDATPHATPPPIRTGARGTAQGAPLPRSNTYQDSRHPSVAPAPGDSLQRSNTTNTLRQSFHRTPTGLSTKGGLFAKKQAIEQVNLEGGLEITLNVEVNCKDPAGITAPYRLLVPRLWYEEPIRAEPGLDGAMEDVPPPLQRGNSFTAGFGGLMRRMSTKRNVPTQQELEMEQPVVRDDQVRNTYQEPRVGDRVGEGGLQRKNTIGNRLKGVVGLGRKRSTESYSGSEMEDEHADTRLVPRANYGKKEQADKQSIGKPQMHPGPVIDDENVGMLRAPPAEQSLANEPTAYKNEAPPRVIYRDPKTEAGLERRASLDRPQAGIQRRNTLSNKLKGAMGLDRPASVGSYTGSEDEHDDTYDTIGGQVGGRSSSQQQTRQSMDRDGPHARPHGGTQRNNSLGGGLKRALGLGRRDSVESYTGNEASRDTPAAAKTKTREPVRETRGPYPSLQAEKQTRRESLDMPPAGVQRRSTLSDKIKGVVGLRRKDSAGSYSGSEVETDDISPHNNRRIPQPQEVARAGDKKYLGIPQQGQQKQIQSMDRPQAGQRKSSLGNGLKKAMGLGRRDSYSEHSYSGTEVDATADPRNNAAGQRREEPPRTGDERYPSLPQKQTQQQPRQSVDRPQGTQRRSSLGGGLKKAIGLGGGRKNDYETHSASESDDEEIARRQANERAAATGDKRYPSLPRVRQPPPVGRESFDGREGKRVDSGPFPQKRKAIGGGFKKIIGLGRKESFGSRSGSERSWSGSEEDLRNMPRGDERFVDTDDVGDRRFKKVSGTRVERGPPIGVAESGAVKPMLKEGQSGFTRQERQRRRMEELDGEMKNPGPKR